METTLIKKFDLAAQHNLLVRAPLKLNITEARIFSLALAGIRKGDEELPTIRIRFSDVFPNSNGSGSDYEALEKACAGLMSKVVTLRSVNGKSKVTELYNIISFLKLDAGTNLVTGFFDERIAPYLLGFVNKFTTLELETLLTLKNPHTHRIMWILKSYQHEGVYEPDIVTFRKMVLGEDHTKHYPEYFDFKRFILNPVMEELNDKTGVNWGVTCDEVKAGLRRVVGLKFTIPVLQENAKTKTKTIAAKKPVVTSATDVTTDTFTEWLAAQDVKLRLAYEGMVDKKKDAINPVVARKIVKHVAGKEGMETTLYSARNHCMMYHAEIAKQGSSRAAYIVNAMKAIGCNLEK